MKNLQNLWRVSLMLLVFAAFFVQSCDEADQNLTPNQLDSELSKAPQRTGSDWMEFGGQLPDPCKSVCLVAGQHDYVGTVDVAMDGDYLLVTYNVTEPDVYLLEVHLEIFTSIEELKGLKKISGGGAIPGKFDYKKSWSEGDMITMHTVKIPLAGLDDCFFVASHAALSNGETAWGGLCDNTTEPITLDYAKQFPGANWSVYFEFCKEECVEEIDFTYAWEDINEDIVADYKNDADYNDLVIQSDVIKTDLELKINFLATARGAGFDHAFKIIVPTKGVDGIFDNDGAEIISEVIGDNYYITIFTSTKAILPAEGYPDATWVANTASDDDTCEPRVSRKITITLNNEFDYDSNIPYDPFITVTSSSGTEYDLNIWELHKNDGSGSFWTRGDLKYPNGILIADNWRWPLEGVNITVPYNNFKDIDLWDKNWADILHDDTMVWSCTTP